MLAFRLRPPPRLFPSRAYSSPSVFNKPPFARPYLWWVKARYRTDGTRRSILLGILQGACYVGVTVYAYRQHQAIKEKNLLTTQLSGIIEMQRISRKYRNSTFTEPAEIKVYITDIARVEFEPTISKVLLFICEHYEVLENVPENREKIRERVHEFREVLSLSVNARKKMTLTTESLISDIVAAVRASYAELALVLSETLAKHTEKQLEKVLEQHNSQPAKK